MKVNRLFFDPMFIHREKSKRVGAILHNYIFKVWQENNNDDINNNLYLDV